MPSSYLSAIVGVVFPLALLLVYLLYLRAVRRERLRGRSWSSWRTTSFSVGIALLATATMPPLLDWAHRDFRGHMLQHLLLGMYAPLGLVLGAPGTLLLRRFHPARARRIANAFASRPLRVLVHPVTAALLTVGGLYVLYLTPLYALSLSNPAVNAWVHVHFAAAGYLFAWSIAGPDPAPHRPSMTTRAVVWFIATAAHADLAKIMYGFGYPRGSADSREVIEAAAQWMYYGGDVAEVLLLVAFFAACLRSRRFPFSHGRRSFSGSS